MALAPVERDLQALREGIFTQGWQSRGQFLVGRPLFFEPKRDEGVVFVIDMTEAASAPEEAFLKVQMQLAHANRRSPTMGQLSASIAP